MIQIITLKQKKEWRAIVKKSCNYDFYHTWDYHTIATEGEPLLFFYEEDENFIAFPLLKRTITNTNLFDLTSVYGYCGPISNISFAQLSESMILNFKSKFINYLKNNNYVSLFSRLNPFFNQMPLMKNFNGIYDNGKIAFVDLRESLENQRSRYQKGLLKKIEKLKQIGFYVKEDPSAFGVKEFVRIYTENMQRVNASTSYLFDETYISNLMNAKDFKCKLIFVYYQNKAICCAIIAHTNGIMQSFLMGTSTEYLKYSPAKLITDEITIIGRNIGMSYFNLGGGLGFKEDTLFAFKTSFTDHLLNYKSWRFIIDQKKYDLLSPRNIFEKDVDFFPIYRYHNTQCNERTQKDFKNIPQSMAI